MLAARRFHIPGLQTPSTATAARVTSAEFNVHGACICIANVAHVELLQKFGCLHRQMEEVQEWDVSGDINILKQKMKSFLESVGSPNSFVVGYRKVVEDI